MALAAGISELSFALVPFLLFFATFRVDREAIGSKDLRLSLVFSGLLLAFDGAWRLLSDGGAPDALIFAVRLFPYPLMLAAVLFFHYYILSRLGEITPAPAWQKIFPLPLVSAAALLGIFAAVFDRAGLAPVLFAAAGVLPLFDIGATAVKARRLGAKKTSQFLIFCALPPLLLIPDRLTGFPFVPLGIAFSLLAVYVTVNVEQQLAFAEQARRFAENRLMLKQSQTKIMISQIQPHFLYNALATIGYLCKKEPRTASKAIDAFAEYLRTNLSAISSDETVPFSAELEHTKTYLWLEKLRFEERLNVVYDIQTTDFRLPALTVQPLVENAVKHGLCEKPNGGTLTLRTVEYADAFVVTIEDDGVGFVPGEAKKDGRLHVGIDNVRNRLASMSRASLEIASTVGKGTHVTIRIPKESEE